MKLVIREAARSCGLEPEVIERFIDFTWVRPADAEERLLDEEDLSRCTLIWHLQNDLGVNDEAVPVILHLIDLLHGMRSRMGRE